MVDFQNHKNAQKKNCIRHKMNGVMLICLHPQCIGFRLSCVRCVDELHYKHEILSLRKFYETLENTLPINHQNIHRKKIYQHLEHTQTTLIQKIDTIRSQLTGKLAHCQQIISKHFLTIYQTLSTISVQQILQSLRSSFDEETFEEYVNLLKKNRQIVHGTAEETKIMMKATEKIFLRTIEEIQISISKQIEKLSKSLQSLKNYTNQGYSKKTFSQNEKPSFMMVCDTGQSVIRKSGTGGYPVCLLQSPMNPVHNWVKFRITAQGNANRNIWVGVGLKNIVKNTLYQKCNGINKGTWAIDQGESQNKDNDFAIAWNHHNSQFNYSSHYNSQNNIGYQFGIGQIVEIIVDFQNSSVLFRRGQSEYEMPIRLDLGLIYAFVGCYNVGDTVQVINEQ